VTHAALVAIPLLLRALAHTLETCEIKEVECEFRDPCVPNLDASTSPIRMERLTELDLPDALWTPALCRVLQCPRLPVLCMTPQMGARVSSIVLSLDACDRFTMHLDHNFLITDEPCQIGTDQLPRIHSLKLVNAVVQPLASLLSWFPFLTTLEIDTACVDEHQTIILFQNLVELGEAIASWGRTQVAQHTITELIVRSYKSVPVSDQDQDVKKACRPFVDVLRAFPHVRFFDPHPQPHWTVKQELESIVEARSNIVRDRTILENHNL
jgi:hypothetical protein